MRKRAGVMLYACLIGTAIAGAIAVSGSQVQADDPNSAPNPYHVVEHWAKLPEGRMWGQAIGVDIDRDGTSLWVFDRCAGKTCEGSNVAPIQKFDATGRLVASFGAGLFDWPHGLAAASDGTVWVTDGKRQGPGTVMQFSADGKLLKTLGKPGVAGNGSDTSTRHRTCSSHRTATSSSPTATAISRSKAPTTASSNSPRRQIHQSLGPSRIGAGRIRRAAWARHGFRPAGFTSPTGPTTASRFSIPDGKFVAEWKQFGRPSGVAHPRRHPLCRRLAIERQSQRTVPSRHPHRQRQGRQGDGLHRRDGPQGGNAGRRHRRQGRPCVRRLHRRHRRQGIRQELSASGTRTAQSGVRLQPPDPAGMYAPAPPARPSLKAAN